MRVLVACEYSGIVRDAFIRQGHDAMSCDLLPSDSDSGPHHQGDVRELLIADRWDLLIAHPPCTFLAVSGAAHFNKPGRRESQEDALDFVARFMCAPVPRIAIENPVSVISSRIRKPDQIIHPWQFGHTEQKSTCLWLKGLQPLIPTSVVHEEMMLLPPNQRERLRFLPPGPNRWKLRSQTYQGIADAMADQWGPDGRLF